MGTRFAFSDFFSSPSSSNSRYSRLRARRKVELKPQCEQLEIKIAPATFTWTGAVAGGHWSDPGNWNNNQVPTGSSADLIFPVLVSGKASVDDLSAMTSFQSITIQDANYNLIGNPLSLSGGLTYTGPGASTYAIPTTFTNASTISDSNGPLTISGQITLGGSETVSDTAGVTLTVSGGIGESSSGSGLTLTGGGTLVLGGTNTYTGATTVNAGTLQVDGTSTGSVVSLGIRRHSERYRVGGRGHVHRRHHRSRRRRHRRQTHRGRPYPRLGNRMSTSMWSRRADTIRSFPLNPLIWAVPS